MNMLELYWCFLALSHVYDFGDEESSVSHFEKTFLSKADVYVTLFIAKISCIKIVRTRQPCSNLYVYIRLINLNFPNTINFFYCQTMMAPGEFFKYTKQRILCSKKNWQH